MKTHPCSLTACNRTDAIWRPGFQVYLPDPSPPVPLAVWTNLVLCDDCKAKTTLDDIVTDEGWDALIATLAEHGRRQPQRGKTELAWSHVNRKDLPAAVLRGDPRFPVD